MQHKTWRERIRPLGFWDDMEMVMFIEQVEQEAEKRGREKAVKYVETNLMWGRDEKKNLVMDSRHLTAILEAARTEESSSKEV